MIGASSVCTKALVKMGFFSLFIYELGMSAIMLLGKAEFTWAKSKTCICLEDLDITGDWVFINFFTILTFDGDLLFKYSSFDYKRC